MSFLPVTLFTTCKPFNGETGVMQENALRSWTRLQQPLLVFGDEEGVAALCKKIGATHIPEIERSNSGAPLLNALFEKAKALTETTYLAYVNADIILRKDFIDFLQQLDSITAASKPMLIVARRQNIPLSHPVSPDANGDNELDQLIDNYGSWDEANAADLFIFHRDLLQSIPPLALGRQQWDNWLLWKARTENADIIDATGAISALHPVHGYASHTSGWSFVTQGVDAQRNRDLCQGQLLSIAEARTHILHHGELMAAPDSNINTTQHFSTDPKKAIAGTLSYLLSGLDTRPLPETLDCLRSLLWNNQIYFPLEFQTIPSRDMIHQKLIEALQHISDNNTTACLHTLQDTLACDLVRQAKYANTIDRPLLIWGAGQLGKRLQQLFERLHINYLGFLDSDQQRIDENINGKHILASHWQTIGQQTGRTPFIVIASMYYREIAQSLQTSGLICNKDFLA